MCNNGKFFFYFIRLIAVILSLTVIFKGAKITKKKSNKYSETKCSKENKKLKNRLSLYKVFQGNSATAMKRRIRLKIHLLHADIMTMKQSQ